MFSRVFFLQRSHINPFSRITLHVWHRSSRISVVWWGFPYRSKFIIWSMSVWTSGTFSIVMMFPRSFVVYLLIADWDKPRSFAACFSFIPCFSTMVLAMSALIAGKTVWTPTSQGNSKSSTNSSISVRNIYKYDVCHIFYDACHDGYISFPRSFSPNLSLLTRQGTVKKENIK
jgi:hypothetical protein